MYRLYGLKASVVRALHFLYPPFADRVKAITTFEQHPDVLKKRQCVLMWHEKSKSQWLYYFKLKENLDGLRPRSYKEDNHKPDLLEMLEDVNANQDEHCRILKITCSHFIPISPVLGLTLNHVSLTLSQV